MIAGKKAMKMRRTGVAPFLAAEGILYVWFLRQDLAAGGAGSVPLKYASIVLCALFSLFWAAGGGDRLTAAAMALTAAADGFLLVLNACYGAGVLLFCGAQGCYCARIYRRCCRSLWGLRLLLFPASLAALERLGLLTALNALALFYFTNFLCNVLCSAGRFRLFFAGLVLFLCCDLCVAAFQFPEYLPAAVFSFVRVGMWLFYLPGQALIALSGMREVKEREIQ